jgi:hypothetical protein
MKSKHFAGWSQVGARATTFASRPARFLFDYLSALFFKQTEGLTGEFGHIAPFNEEQFWKDDKQSGLRSISLHDYKITDWFPRAPGVSWSRHAEESRRYVWSERPNSDPVLGDYFAPGSKRNLVEEGGIGTIRMRPRVIDGEKCWFATALKGNECHRGIPLLIPDKILKKTALIWGGTVNIEGRIRFLQDAGLNETAARVHHASPLIVFVEKLSGVSIKVKKEPIVITPVALFGKNMSENSDQLSYTFVHCAAGPVSEIEAAGEWIENYAKLHKGRVLTNFDEQNPILADAPLSYQSLIEKKYDKKIIQQIGGTIMVESVARLTKTMNLKIGEINMGHKINVGGSAIINNNSTLTNVTQTIEATTSLDSEQKKQLKSLIAPLTADLARLSKSHAEEVQEITSALAKVVAQAAKPPKDRKKGLLNLSAKGLKEAASLVKNIMPSILKSASLIANFINTLPS